MMITVLGFILLSDDLMDYFCYRAVVMYFGRMVEIFRPIVSPLPPASLHQSPGGLCLCHRTGRK